MKDKKYLIEMQPGGTRAMAFGLTWHTTLGNDPDAVAAKIAVRDKAVAYTRGGARSTVVGLLRTRKRAELPNGRVEVFSAAAVFARGFARGRVALRMDIPGGTWLVAAVDGVVVLGTDVIYETPEEANAHLEQLRATYRGLTVYGDKGNDLRLPNNALANQLDTSTRLKRTTRSFAQVPVIVWAALALLVFWAVADYGYGLYQNTQRAKRDAARQAPLPVDPVASWSAALRNWAGQVRNHEGVLPILLHEMANVPLTTARWDLVDMDCTPAAWHCAARYKRGPLGTNDSFRQALPSGWEVRWTDLDNVAVRWHLPQPAPDKPLELDSLLPQEQLTLAWSSTLQRLAPALSDVALGDPTPVAIAPPTETRFDGTLANIAFPQHSELQLPVARNLIVNGPMRSLYLLDLPYGAAIDQVQVRRAPVGSPGINASALTATLTGKIYAK